MSETREHLVVRLTPDNVPEIVSVLSDAFHDYPVMRYTLGADAPGAAAPYDVRLHRLVQLFVSGRSMRDEPMLGVRDSGGRLTGAAVMTPPDSAAPPPRFVALREAVWAELGAEARARYDAYVDASQRLGVPGRHHHLNMIGVRREQHGLGLGRALLDAVHALAAEDPASTGVSLTTEHPPNVRLYEHVGYRVHAHGRIAAGLETWIMFRERT